MALFMLVVVLEHGNSLINCLFIYQQDSLAGEFKKASSSSVASNNSTFWVYLPSQVELIFVSFETSV